MALINIHKNPRKPPMIPVGPQNARILILGDWPDQLDVMKGQPFSSSIGLELGRLLHEAGGMLSSCMLSVLSTRLPALVKGKEDFSKWLCHTKSPKNHLWKRLHTSWVDQELANDIEKTHALIALVKPNVIIALGNLSLLALTGRTSIKKWRGSQLVYESDDWTCQVVPAYHPRYIQRDYSVRAVTVHDLRRVLRISTSPVATTPSWVFQVRPSFSEALLSLRKLRAKVEAAPTPISVDIETRAGHLACIGFATDKKKAFCIPLMCVERKEGYWSATEELVLINEMREVMTHRNAKCFGQNFLYDVQYIYRFWFFVPNIWYDTMLTQHLLFPGTPKGLDYLASLYCEHYVYWKDDGKLWDESTGEDQLWTYNCEDCVRTFEVMENQLPSIAAQDLSAQWDFQQNHLYHLLLKAMFRGVRADIGNKAALSFSLMGEITEREQWLEKCLGHPLNVKSPKQMQELFSDDLKLKPVISRATGRPTLDDKALVTHATREPALRTFIGKIQELRSLSVFKSTFVDAKLDSDKRLRSSYNPAGTDTFRLSSSENAFGSGLNFQNVPLGGSDPDDPDSLVLPNVRELFLPDPGFTIFDMDLQSADFYTVVWEADDQEFRDMLASGADTHGVNAKDLFGLSCASGEVKKFHKDKRKLAKIWCHATNYGAGPTTMSRACGITIHEAERLRSRWFQMHPGISRWHKRTEAELHSHHRVTNKFGYRFIFFDRIDAALPQALGWTPQSTTGCVINRAWDNIDRTLPDCEILIQVHDSLVGQVPTHLYTPAYELQILAASRIIVPYDKPMIIPAGIKSSTLSWGDCK